jgi:8-oxo-dGTP diphosphatase
MIDLACGIFMRNGLIFIVRRASHKRWYPDRWDVIGGHVEKGESVEEALIRECVEEVGLTPTQYASLAQLPEPEETGHKRAHYHVYLITEWMGGDPKLLGDEHTEMRWVAPSEAAALPDLSHPQYASVFRALIARY